MDRQPLPPLPLPRWARLIGTVVIAIIAIPFIVVTIAAQAKDARR